MPRKSHTRAELKDDAYYRRRKRDVKDREKKGFDKYMEQQQ